MLCLDKEYGNHLWEDAINKEMSKVKLAYELYPDHTPAKIWKGKGLHGYQEIKCHIVFDVKMDFNRKAHFIMNGMMMEAPVSLMYSSVISCDCVKFAFLISVLNDLKVSTCEIGNHTLTHHALRIYVFLLVRNEVSCMANW